MIKSLGATGVLGLMNFRALSGSGTDKQVKMKTIGILGGIGPQATMDFELRVHQAARKLIAPLYNSGYPPMVVYYHRYAPVLLHDDMTPVLPLQPDPGLLEGARKLGAIADFLVITSNGVHGMQKEIEHAAGRKVVSMVDATLEEVRKRQWKKVGVLGYKNAMVYTTRLEQMGISCETINEHSQAELDKIVMKVMEGRDDERDMVFMMQVIRELRNRKVDGIIPGCTEIPLLLKGNMDDADIVNPAQLLAEAAVRYSLG